jgi:translation initiation factor IF-1
LNPAGLLHSSTFHYTTSDKMGKSMKKSKQSAQRKNATLNQVVMKEEDVLFGRTVKKLGNGYFRIQTTDTEDRGTEVNAVIAGKSVVRIEIGDIIIVGRNESSGKVSYEILGALDKKTAQQLREAKRFHPSLISDADTDGDELFDRTADAGEEEESGKPKMDKANKPVKKDKALKDDGEVDVDVI